MPPLPELERADPNERFRARRTQARRRRRLRSAAALGALVTAAAIVALGATVIGTHHSTGSAEPQAKGVKKKLRSAGPRALPTEVRGVHVTMALASIPGKIDEYLALQGLNTLEVDVKDESGAIGFPMPNWTLARQVGASKQYYKASRVADKAHKAGVYLIGRVVVFEDPVLTSERPDLAIRTTGGSVWQNDAGLGWSNPYDRRVWKYVVTIGKAAARAGFDEIQFDYVRFPTDGDVDAIVYPGKTTTPPGWVIAEFAHYATKRLKPLGVRVSTDLFGLAATRDLGIGQVPRRLAKYVDAIYPMVYPSHFGSGEYGLEEPNDAPGATVEWSLSDFRQELKKGKAELIPWLQDFSYGRTYKLADVRAQIDAARLMGARGYLLWNPLGIYTPGALAPA